MYVQKPADVKTTRFGQVRYPHGKCTACNEILKTYELLPLECGHEYCRECLQEGHTLSFKAQATFPFKCCSKSTKIEEIRLFLTSDIANQYKEKTVEYGTPNRTYCSKPTCSAFIPQELVIGNSFGKLGHCQKCSTVTCGLCHQQWHSGACTIDPAINKFLKGVRRCPNCCRLVEHNGKACNSFEFVPHFPLSRIQIMLTCCSCHCGYKFCFVCDKKWKTCECTPLESKRKADAIGRGYTDVPHLCPHLNWYRQRGRDSCDRCGEEIHKVGFKCTACVEIRCKDCAT